MWWRAAKHRGNGFEHYKREGCSIKFQNTEFITEEQIQNLAARINYRRRRSYTCVVHVELRTHHRSWQYVTRKQITAREALPAAFHACAFVQRIATVQREHPYRTHSYLSKIQTCHATRHGGAWRERRYNSYPFSTSTLDGGEWLALRPSRALPPGKDPQYPFYRKLSGHQSQSGHRG
jgi:hypothetical protein